MTVIYITGDIHGDPCRVEYICRQENLGRDDILVLLGDVAANYDGGKLDKAMKKQLAQCQPTILCIHGNHEARPETIPGYVQKQWNGGTVWYQTEYPNLLFARDGEIFLLNGLSCIAIGGAYSVDKYRRLARGWSWWEDEQPSPEIRTYVESQIRTHHVDVVLSHTCPAKYTPFECYLPGIDQSGVDTSTEDWLDRIEDELDYRAWYCGHWHTDKQVKKVHFLFWEYEKLICG